MDAVGIFGLVIFWLLLVSVCVLLVVTTRRVGPSAVIATLLAALVIQLLSFVHLGYFEPFYQLTFMFSILMGLPVALAVAFLTRRYLRRRDKAVIGGKN